MSAYLEKELGVIRFAEKVLGLLEEGKFSATYKFAVLLALMDLCFERSLASGAPPESVTTEQLAEKIIEIYYPHTLEYPHQDKTVVLSQNCGRPAKILSAIIDFRTGGGRDPSATLHRMKISAPADYHHLLKSVEWTLIEMPLPKLQKFGNIQDRFIYEINWDESIRKRDMLATTFDNLIRLKPGVGDYLVQLNALLRPLIHRKWVLMVAQFNKLPETALEDFLFGAQRVPTIRIRKEIWELQQGRCFYCTSPICDPVHAEVDHFIPWSRYPDNGLENLVVADRRCNGSKRDFLAAAAHVERWKSRFDVSAEAAQLTSLARDSGWERHPDQTIGAARALYLRLPNDIQLWNLGRDFVSLDLARIRSALGFRSSI